MDSKIALWIVGAIALPILGWGIRITWLVGSTHKKTEKLVEMHLEPDRYGFGTIKSNKQLEDNTRAVKQLTHYMKWLVTEQTGKTPPPYVED